MEPMRGRKPEEESYVLLLSTMRSGSTLLKALLATAPDIAHLPEVNFKKILKSPALQRELEIENPEPILLLKRPAWFHEIHSYPKIPIGKSLRRVILLRDVYETVRSVGKMLGGRHFDRFPGMWGYRLIARHYWAPVTKNLLAQSAQFPDQVLMIRYEDLLTAPETETARIFKFLGSEQKKGLRRYTTPDNFNWKWGSDDGSARIRSHEVQPPRELSPTDWKRKETICSLPGINKIRDTSGYTSIYKPIS